jgi:hypothetical protein
LTEVAPVLESVGKLDITRLVRAGVTAERDPVWDRTPVLPTPGELRQRFASLAGIAIDAMRLGGGRLGIQISASRRFDHPAQLPRITIAYPWIGIPPEVLPVVFDQADQARGLLSWKRISAGKFRRS